MKTIEQLLEDGKRIRKERNDKIISDDEAEKKRARFLWSNLISLIRDTYGELADKIPSSPPDGFLPLRVTPDGFLPLRVTQYLDIKPFGKVLIRIPFIYDLDGFWRLNFTSDCPVTVSQDFFNSDKGVMPVPDSTWAEVETIEEAVMLAKEFEKQYDEVSRDNPIPF